MNKKFYIKIIIFSLFYLFFSYLFYSPIELAFPPEHNTLSISIYHFEIVINFLKRKIILKIFLSTIILFISSKIIFLLKKGTYLSR